MILIAGTARNAAVRPAPADGPVPWPVYDPPKALFAGADVPATVCVAFTHRPTPTADPLVWLYHPSSPPVGPPYYEIHFGRPKWGNTAPFRVEGTPHLRKDGLRRINRVPGTVILAGASLR